jgi:hypothetical protein
MSQPRSLLSIARSKSARSRVRPASGSRVRMAQTCFGCSGGFGPMSLFLFQGLRETVMALVSLRVSMVFLPYVRRRPRMLRRPTDRRMSGCQSEAVTMHWERPALTILPDPKPTKYPPA